MKCNTLSQWSLRTVTACAGVAWACLGTGNACLAQSTPTDLSPDIQEVLTLSRQHMDDSVITNYIASTGKTYKLSADDIIYLNGQGVSQGVITALLKTSALNTGSTPPPAPASAVVATPSTPAPPAAYTTPEESAAPPAVSADVTVSAPADVAPATPPPTLDYFQAQLAPYGNWITLPDYGLCWQPAVFFGWRPYYDGGHWDYTDAGWFWQSDYPWGDITFHYGRWTYTTSGWVWVPGYEYAPSWVVWRHDDADGYVGWAPLPPGAVFVNGGWVFHGRPVGVDFDFGLGVNFFTFVGYNHFWDHDYRRFIVPHESVVFAFGHSGIENHYQFNHGIFMDVGMPHDHIVAYTHSDPHPATFDSLRIQEQQHNNWQRSQDIHNFTPGSQPNATHWTGGSGGGSQGNQGGWGHPSQGGGWR